MSHRGKGGGEGPTGGRRNKLRRGAPKADDRPAKNEQQKCSGDLPREGLDKTKIEDKSQKEVNIIETTDKQDVQGNVGKESVDVTFDFSCNKSECVKIRTQYQELLTEKEHYKERIKQLQKEIGRLTSKEGEDNVSKEVMEVDSSTKHTVAPRNTAEHVADHSLGDIHVRSSKSAEKSDKLLKEEAKGDSRSQEEQSLEKLKKENWADDNAAWEESGWPAQCAGIQQNYSNEADDWTQNYGESNQQVATLGSGTQNNSAGSQQNWCDEVEEETKNTQIDTAESSNITHDSYEQNSNEKQHSAYIDPRSSGSSGSGSKDYRPRNQKSFGENRWQHKQIWRNNQGEQSVKRRRVLNEIEGDLFTAPKSFSLAHCVAEDMRMGSGIAVTFRQMFQRVDELLDQGAQTGGLAVLNDEGRFVYYLVTKRLSNSKPQLKDLKSSLTKMKQHMLDKNVRDVAMPRIGCGLDRLDWYDVKRLLIEIFGDDDFNITVYTFNQEQGERNQQRSSLRITHAPYSLPNIEYGTGLLYLGSEDGAISESLANLLQKYPILHQYRQSSRHVGQFVRTESNKEVLYGLIVKKNASDEFSFTVFSKCLVNLRSKILKDTYQYAGLDVFPISNDLELDTEKLLTIFKNAWFKTHLNLYVCWPEKYISVFKECYDESQKFRWQ